MALSADDLADIARVVDQRLAADRRAAAARARWRRLAVLLVVLALGLAGWWWLRRHLDALDDRLADQALAVQDARLAYQRELQRSERLQRERATAAAAVGHVDGRPRAQHEADLLSGLVRVYGQARAAQQRLLTASDDDEALLAAAEESGGAALAGSDLLMRLLLGLTDPARQDAGDRRQDALASDGAAAPDPAPAEAAPAPAR